MAIQFGHTRPAGQPAIPAQKPVLPVFGLGIQPTGGWKFPVKDEFTLRFGAAEVEGPDATPQTGQADAAKPAYKRGLEGVIADRTEISDVDPATSSLIYRGYDIRDLVNKSTFEETAYLLLHGDLPNEQQLNDFKTAIKKESYLSGATIRALRSFPKSAHPMDKLAAAVSLLKLEEKQNFLNDNSHEANVQKSINLIAKLPLIVAAQYRLEQHKGVLKPNSNWGIGENFLYMMTGKAPDKLTARVFEQTLIAYADHGFNASTTAARVTASTQSDMYSAIASAIGTLKGPLHGGANEQVMRMLKEIGTVENAEPWVMGKLAQGEKIMGFGHREYKTGDPRSKILTEKAAELAAQLGDSKWHDIAQKVVQVMDRELAAKGKAPLPTNVDYPIGYIYHMLGLPLELYTPIFALARVAGWTSQVTELHDDNRLYRPKADYVGKKGLAYKPLDQRA